MVITPTVGRVVWYTPVGNEPGVTNHQDGQPFAAIVTYVWDDRMVNLAAFDHNGVVHSRTSVQLVQEGDEGPSGPSCRWMPFQIGQAKRHEAEQKP